MWELVLWWTGSKYDKYEFATRDEAKACIAARGLNAPVIELYGPNGEYESA